MLLACYTQYCYLPREVVIPTSVDTMERTDILEVRNRQINAVHTISRELSKTLDLDERLNHILSVSIETVNATGGTIYLYRTADDKLVFRNVFGEKARELTGLAISAHVGVCGAVFQSGKPQ